jgi:hypothetical protein
MVAFSLVGCREKVKTVVTERKVFVDSVFTEQFLPRGDGFTGGDGTYSVQLPDGRTLWIFGDTFIGSVTPELQRVKTTPSYIRNSFVTVADKGLNTFQQGERSEFKSMIIPPEVTKGSSGTTEQEMWYWPGAGFVADGKLKVFVSKFSQKDHSDMWAFNFLGTELVEFSLPDLKQQEVHHFPELDNIHFGHALMESGEFYYIYGLKKEHPYVARAPRKNILAEWEFFDGKNWGRNSENAVPVLEFVGSEQFSVFEWKGTYIMIMQEGDLGRKIYSFTSKNPEGPWANQKLIYETPIPAGCGDCWTYNALAHPQLTENEMLLVSYNTNSMTMEDHYKDALIYRPRFFRVPLELILNP